MSGNKLDPVSKQFQDEVEQVVRKYAGDSTEEYFRRWRQLHNWGMNRAHGDVYKKAKLRKLLMVRTNSCCMDCGKTFEAAELQMHRLDPKYAYDQSHNFGYFDGNVDLLCRPCHDKRDLV